MIVAVQGTPEFNEYSVFLRAISVALSGKPKSLETKLKYSLARKGKYVGDKHPNWKGGITPVHQIIRNSKESKEWAAFIRKRDNFTCQECGAVVNDSNATVIS